MASKRLARLSVLLPAMHTPRPAMASAAIMRRFTSDDAQARKGALLERQAKVRSCPPSFLLGHWLLEH
jgi:hypothetical protein